jgi:hypothetical protein
MAVADFIYKIGADVTQFTKSISDVEAELNKWQKSLKDLTGQALVDANKNIQSLQQSLINLKNAGLNQLPKATGSATNALFSLNQVARDLPFGFIAIQNNLPLVADSFQSLVTSSGGVGAAFKSIGSALIGPAGLSFAIGAVISGITALSIKYGSLSDAYDVIVLGREKLSKEQKQLIDGFAEESTKVLTLFGLYKNLDSDRNKQVEVLKKLNDVAPAYFGNLNSEANKLENVTAAVDKYIESLLGKLFVETQQAKVTEILKKYAEQLNKVIDSEINNQKIKDKNANKTKNQLDLINNLADAQKNLKGDIAVGINVQPVLKTNQQVINELKDNLKNEIGDLFSATGAFKNVINLDDLFGKDKKLKKKREVKVDFKYDIPEFGIGDTKNQIKNIADLADTILDVNKKTVDRKNALLELKGIDNEYFKNLDLEKTKLIDIQDAIDTYIHRLQVAEAAIISRKNAQKLQNQADENTANALNKLTKAEEDAFEKQVKIDEYIYRSRKSTQFTPQQVAGLGFSKQVVDQYKKVGDITKAIEKVQNNFLNLGKSIFQYVQQPLTEIFDIILSKGEQKWQDFTKTVLESLKKLLIKLAIAAALAAALSAITGGAANAAGGGLGFKEVFGSLLGIKLGGKSGSIANPGFSGINPGGMAMNGSVNLVLRGQDLVGSLNRTNSQLSRIG